MTQPDIHYFPDFKKYQARTKRRLETENIDYSFPPGFPKKLESSLVWEGTDFEAPTGASVDWVYTLSDGELKEVDLALRYFNSLEKEYGYISPDTFPLQTLHSRLRGFSDEIHAGRGFIVLRGLPVHKYSRAENLIIFVGISSHIGSQRGRQDHSFEGEPADVVLSHIIDLQNTAHRSSIGAPAYTNDLQAFHTDSGDIIGLYMLSESAIGGESQIASSWRVYNELANLRPDLLRTLAEDWVIDRKKSATPYINRPLIYHQPQNSRTPERVVLQCSRGSFTTFGALKRSPNIPPITEAQAEALDALHFLAEKFHLSFAM